MNPRDSREEAPGPSGSVGAGILIRPRPLPEREDSEKKFSSLHKEVVKKLDYFSQQITAGPPHVGLKPRMNHDRGAMASDNSGSLTKAYTKPLRRDMSLPSACTG